MNLPVINTPTFEFEIPSDPKRIIKYRPFLVKEQKILLMALESKEEAQILNSVKQIASNCILEKDFDINSLAPFDLQLFFLQLRAKSIGETVVSNYRCTNVIEQIQEEKVSSDESPEKINITNTKFTCNNIIKIEYNLMDTKVHKVPEHTNKIYVSENVGLVLKYPSLDTVAKIQDKVNSANTNNIDMVFDLIYSCLDFIFDKDSVTLAKDITKEDLNTFLENLPQDKFEKIENFFETMPVVRQVLTKECNKCGFKHEIILEGLQSFFD